MKISLGSLFEITAIAIVVGCLCLVWADFHNASSAHSWNAKVYDEQDFIAHAQARVDALAARRTNSVVLNKQ